MKKTIYAVLTLCVLTLCSVGCATHKSSARAAAVESRLDKTRKSLKQTETNINSAISNLNTMEQKGINLKKLYPNFVKNVKSITASAEKLKNNKEKFEDVFNERFESWRLSLNQINDEELHDKSRERMKEQMKEHQEFIEQFNKVETVMNPLVKDLTNIKQFLDIELSYGSVQTLSKHIRRAGKDATEVKEWIKTVTKEINDIIGTPVKAKK